MKKSVGRLLAKRLPPIRVVFLYVHMAGQVHPRRVQVLPQRHQAGEHPPGPETRFAGGCPAGDDRRFRLHDHPLRSRGRRLSGNYLCEILTEEVIMHAWFIF